MLRNGYLFKELSLKELDEVCKLAVVRKVPKNCIFIEEGQEAHAAYLIVAGLTKVYKINSEGKEIHIALRIPGEIVGEIALLDGGSRSAYVKTLQDTTLLVIPKNGFVKLVHSTPSIAQAVIKTLAFRIRENSELIHNQNAQKLSDRMLKLLCAITNFFPSHEVT